MHTLNIQDQGAIRTITLNRPEVRNAMSAALQQELHEAFKEARVLSSVRAVILTGSGKAFSAGLDLNELKAISSKSTEENREDSHRFRDLLELIYTFPKPVVAALNGHAVAGGAGLATVCDLVLMSEDAKIGYTEAKIGFVAALVGVFLVRLVGEKYARDLLLTGRLISAQKAQEIGLINEFVSADKIQERAFELAQSLAANAPSSLSLTKQLLAAVPSMGLSEALNYASELNAMARSTENLKEGVSAFLEKRDPSWYSS